MSASPAQVPEGERLTGKLPPGLGEWLFKEKDQVLGPVGPELLVTKLYEGSVAADTPVAREIGQWKPLREVWFLGAHVPRAQQRLAYLRALDDRQALLSRQARTRLTMLTLGFAVAFVVALGIARWTMMERPWADKTDWLTRRPAFVGLPDRTPPPKLAVATPKPDPTPAPAATPAGDPKADEKDKKDTRDDKGADEGRGKKGKKGKDAKEEKNDKGKDAKKDEPKDAKKDDAKAKADAEKEAPKVAGVAQELTTEQITATFKAGAGGYMACIREEAARNPEMPSTITVEFIIRNDGSTAEFKVQERDIREGPLAGCLSQKIAALRFPRFTGERKQFIFPFKITRRK